jgi:hypothetical protein
MPKRKPGRPARDPDPPEEEIALYVDDVADPSPEDPPLPVLLEVEERQVWAGFYSSVMCGAAASCGGELVNAELCALQADDMLREWLKRTTERGG